MSRGGGSYDESLLRDAPVATREQLQEGYNPDILNGPTRNKSVHRPSPIQQTPSGAAAPIPPVPLRAGVDLEQGNTVPGGNSANAYSPLNEKLGGSTRPFWRTTRGIVAIAIIIVVILGAIIGGAVGGTVSKKKNNNNQASFGPGTTKGPAGGGGVGIGGEGGTATNATPTSATITTTSINSPLASVKGAVTLAVPTETGIGGILHDHINQLPSNPLNTFTNFGNNVAKS